MRREFERRPAVSPAVLGAAFGGVVAVVTIMLCALIAYIFNIM